MTITLSALREGRHCQLRAWKSHHTTRSDRRRPYGSSAHDEVRHLSRALFPGAADAAAGGADAAARTAALVHAGAPCILNATCTSAGLQTVVDVLERGPRGRWIAVLVHSGVRVSERLAERAAFTLHALRGTGLRVAAVHALLLDPAYVRPAGGVSAQALFVRRSMSFPARRRLARVARDVATLQATHASPEPPHIAAGAHCRDDREGCPYLDQCTAALPDDWTGWMPRKDRPPVREWLARGHLLMRDVPDDRQLPRSAEHARLASRTGCAYVAQELRAALAPAGPPAFYLDFECVAPAVPLYTDTRPYEVVPFLWSLHHDDGDGRLTHVDDIAPPGGDAPRRRMAEGLIRALGRSSAPILVYSGYEQERLRELSAALPDCAEALDAIQARLVDLLEIVRTHVYDLRFRGSFSIKQVAPVLAPALTYADLPIRDGLSASDAYARMHAQADAHDAAETLWHLRAYCARDTLALVALHRALRQLLPAQAQH